MMNDSIEIKRSEWFSNSTGTVGAVLCYDSVTGRYKAYIGCIADSPALTQKGDSEYIAEWGSKLHYEIAVGLFPEIRNAFYEWD